jgi:hypothetical protein
MRITQALVTPIPPTVQCCCSKFDDVWCWLGEKVTLLRDFAGGLATVFPSTATVESDFSLMKWEKSKFKFALTDFLWKASCTTSNTKQY